MRKSHSKLSAGVVGFSMLLAACSGGSEAPDALAFQDDDSSGGETETVNVNRPTGNPCSSNEFSIAFDESVVLLDPDQVTAGPFSVNVPAGTYDIVVSTWLGFEELPAQTMEQWYFTTDSGYTSPITNDPSPELLWNQAFEGQTIGDTTSVTLHHKAPGMESVNSVHPICIGFRSVAPVETTTTTEAPVEETTTTTEAEVEETTTTTEAEETEAVDGDVEVAGPTTTTTTTTTTTVAADPTEAPELALTGPSELATSLGLTGAALVVAGGAALVAARRSEDDQA